MRLKKIHIFALSAVAILGVCFSQPASAATAIELAGTSQLVVPLYSNVVRETGQGALSVPLYSNEIRGVVVVTTDQGETRRFIGNTVIRVTLEGDAERGEYMEVGTAENRGLVVPLYSAPTGLPFPQQPR